MSIKHEGNLLYTLLDVNGVVIGMHLTRSSLMVLIESFSERK